MIMLYHEYLLKVLKGECPFCDVNENYIVEKGKDFSVILARAPYVKDHILIIPNRHLVRMGEITAKERKSLVPMIEKWTKNLEKFHEEVNLLLRDGIAKGVIGKSVDHLHFHLVPDCPLYTSTGGPNRVILSDYQLTKKTSEFKNKFKRKRKI